jgi:hypothetical protein
VMMRADMATWRRRAIETFPELRRDLNDPGYSIYLLFFDLLVEVRVAHREQREERLRSIYGFAQWCFHQDAEPLWNAAGVAFYEHLFDERWMREAAAPWLPADVREGCIGLWRARLPAADFAEVERLLAQKPPAPAA